MLDHTNLEEYADPIAYDLENEVDEEGPFFLDRAARYGDPVLDIACGTGRITIPLAEAGHRCVGIDIAEPMLRHARAKTGELPATYLSADARDFDLGELFGFALLTGHAFQALMTDDDQRRALAAVFRHVRPGGGFAFETRDPAARELVPEERIYWERSYQSSTGAWIDAHCKTVYDPDTSILHVRQHRTLRETGEERVTRIALRYSTDDHCRQLIEAAGFRIAEAYADWDLQPIGSSPHELIYVCERP